MARRSGSKKLNAKGRNATTRFVRLDFKLLTSNAFRSLSPNARSLIIELSMLDNGENNGSLYLGVQDAAHRIGVSDHHAASRAFDELQSLGLIEMTQDAYFAVKASESSRARTWRLTWLFGPGRKQPNWKFLECEPEPGTRERKRMERGLQALKRYRKDRNNQKFPVVDSTMLPPNSPEVLVSTVVDSTTLNLENGGELPISCMVDSHHHSAVTIGKAAQRTLNRCSEERRQRGVMMID